MQTLSSSRYAAALVVILMLTAPQNVVHAQAAAHSHDAIDSAPDHHKALLENEAVRVLETRIAPGERTPVHAHQWPAALYVLSWSDFACYDPSGKVLLDSRAMKEKPTVGAALWSAPLPTNFKPTDSAPLN